MTKAQKSETKKEECLGHWRIWIYDLPALLSTG